MEKIEVVYVDPCSEDNRRAGTIVIEELIKRFPKRGVNFSLKSQQSLNKIGRHIKNNPSAIGVVAYFSNTEQIKSRGIDVVNKFKLFINGIKRICFKDEKAAIVKDYLIISSDDRYKDKFFTDRNDNWATLVRIEKKGKKLSPFWNIESLLLQHNISYSKWRIKRGSYFYFEANCHVEKLECLATIENCKVRVLGTYKLPQGDIR